MKPRSFSALAAAAAVSLVAALLVYSSSLPWSAGIVSGAPLFPALKDEAAKVAHIELKKGSSVLTLDRSGSEWRLREHGGFPANNEKVRALLVKLTEAQLLEPKTQLTEHYTLLELEEPGKDTSSRLLRLLDDRGGVIAEAIVGKQRLDAFGSGQSGTYVRRHGRYQTWLVNAAIDAEPRLRDWVKTRVFETRPSEIRRLSTAMPSAEPLEIYWDTGSNTHKLANIPDDMKLKYVNSIDNIVEAASSFDFDDVRRAEAPAAADGTPTITLELKEGLKVVIAIKREDSVAWLSVAATGDRDAKAAADAINTRANGWEFHVSASKVNSILKRREELLEKTSS